MTDREICEAIVRRGSCLDSGKFLDSVHSHLIRCEKCPLYSGKHSCTGNDSSIARANEWLEDNPEPKLTITVEEEATMEEIKEEYKKHIPMTYADKQGKNYEILKDRIESIDKDSRCNCNGVRLAYYDFTTDRVFFRVDSMTIAQSVCFNKWLTKMLRES